MSTFIVIQTANVNINIKTVNIFTVITVVHHIDESEVTIVLRFATIR